jgi:DNA-binding IclR family transcriptional regulator
MKAVSQRQGAARRAWPIAVSKAAASDVASLPLPLIENKPDTPAEMQRNERGLVKSSARSLQVFEFFQDNGRPARTVEIGRFLGIPNSSADELLKTLAELGYLTFNQQTKCYAPSYRFFNLSKGLEKRFFLDGRLGQIMSHLHRETGETVSLGAYNRQQIQTMTSIFGQWAHPQRLANGRRRELCKKTPRGWEPTDNYCGVLLAAKTDAEVVDLARRRAEAASIPVQIGDFERLVSIVQEVRRRGYSICRGQKGRGIDSVAVGLPPGIANVPMVLGLIGVDLFPSSVREGELVRLLHQSVARYLQ